jgi:hypothetical protein
MKIIREKRKKNPESRFGNNPIYPLLSTNLNGARGTLGIKFTKAYSLSLQMKSFWPKKNSNFMHGLKSAILAFFQKSADWMDWPSPVSTALQNSSQDFFSHLIFHLFF